MKYLYINNGKGFYSTTGLEKDKQDISNISKDDILIILNKCLEEDKEFSMDEYNEDTLHNAAHKIIYRNIFQKLDELRKKQNRFIDDKSNLYKAAIDKYQNELEQLEE